MVFENDEQVYQFIKDNHKPHNWVTDARKNHKVLKALVVGKNFNEVLIEKIEKIESTARQEARKRYSKDIRDMFDRVMQPRISVFSASGGSVNNKIKSEQTKEKLIQTLDSFKGQKSIHKYLAENFFRLADTDPNGVMFVEYHKDEKIYPTYKSINDIVVYKSNGQLIEVILFEPKLHKKIPGALEFRVVDDKKDYTVLKIGETYTIIEEKTFEHPFGKVPGIILSDLQEMGEETRISALFPIEELSKDYARDKSIKTIYKFQHGFPRHWRYVKECRKCKGVGKDGKETCSDCSGTGEIRRNDVTDVTTVAMPREDDQIVTPNIEGFVSPDLDTWKQFNEELRDAEDLIESTMWGTKRLQKADNETATGRFIDVQPVMNKLGKFTDNVEWVHNKLIEWVQNWIAGAPVKSEYHISYGRRFIIEGPDVILERYTESKNKGDNTTILDKLLDEYLLSKYQNNPALLNEQQKKREVEPYVHQDIKTVSEIFGSAEAYKKILFVEFWEVADKNKTATELKQDFADFIAKDNETKKLSTLEVTIKAFSQMPTIVAQEIMTRMSDAQALELIGLKPDNGENINKKTNI